MYNLNDSFGLSSASSPLTSPMKRTSSSATAGGTGSPAGERRSDRHIPDRQSQNAEMSHFILTKENETPPAATRRHRGSANLGDESYNNIIARSLFAEAEQGSVLGMGSPTTRTPPRMPHNPQTPPLNATTPPHDQQPGGGPTPSRGSNSGSQVSTPPPPPSNPSTIYSQISSPPTTMSPQSGNTMNQFNNSLGVVYHTNKSRNFTSPSFRVIPQTPERILDAPELIDDFYLNLVEWGSKNILTVALSQTVYLWNADNGDIDQLMSTDDRHNVVTGVCWHGNGELLAIGTNDSEVQIWDTRTQRHLRTIQGHTGRVGAMSWNGEVLASGSRDSTIRLFDMRIPAPVALQSQGHTQEVCGLRWSPTGTYLASGGNDNVLNIWDFRKETNECTPLWQHRQHTAAIKALAWNPVQTNLLVSGGGTQDKTLRFWDALSGECVNSVDTKSQVCGALWSQNGTELCTSHGYSDNQLTLWKYPSLKRIADLTGHSSRVLHLSQSPNGEVVVSAAGDETIRFWRCFGGQPGVPGQKRNRNGTGISSGAVPSSSVRIGGNSLEMPTFETELR